MTVLKRLLLLPLLLGFLNLSAQLPDCTATNYGYFLTLNGIYNINFAQPSQSFTNSIMVPAGSQGLVVSRNLNAVSPATTFYTILNQKYYYYDGSGWVNTNHYAGEGLNAGGGGGYIFNLGPAGTVYRYDGTGDAEYIVTTGVAGVADIAVDQCGNFFILRNNHPQRLLKYNSDGVLVYAYELTGAPLFTGGGGLIVSGNNVYYDDMSIPGNSSILHGTITGGNVDFVHSGIELLGITDAAACPSPSVRVETTNAIICVTQLPYSWNGNLYTTAGTYTISVTGTSGCDSMAVLNLQINSNVLTSTIDSTICLTELPVNWNGINITQAGTYTINLAGSNGCDSIVTLNLAVSQVPDPPSAISQIEICRFQDAAPLSATASGSLLWYDAASGGTGSSSPPKPSTQNPGNTIYYVSTKNNGCESFRTAINVSVLPTPTLGPDKLVNICFGTSANLNTNLSNNPGGSWTLNQVPVANPGSVSSEGLYKFISVNNFGCADTLNIDLRIQPEIFADAGADDSIMIGFAYPLNGSGGVQYQWFPGFPVLDNPAIANPKATIRESTSFYLTVKDEIGCEGYDTVFIKAYEGKEIWIPSAFTPDGDGRNDLLRPLTSAIKRMDYFRVFNRFGELLFETRDQYKGWDGTYKGLNQETGTYIWNLQALDNQGRLRNLKGTVVLIR